MSNNVPTGPGWWYREAQSPVDEIVFVRREFGGDRLLFHRIGCNPIDVEDDGLWRGPVPMPGTFVLLPDPEPEQFKDDRWYDFTWDRETGVLTPKDQEPKP